MNRTHSQIIEASIDLFANAGFWNTPTSKIAKHAKVSNGTLFNYFESKNLLIEEVYVQLRQEQAAHVAVGYPAEGTVKERAGHIWFRHIDWGVRNPVRFRLLQQMRISNLISEEAYTRVVQEWSFASSLVPEAIESGLYRDVKEPFVVRLAFSQREAAIEYAIGAQLKDMELTQLIARSFEIYWSGIAG